jgi:hypothetical protein
MADIQFTEVAKGLTRSASSVRGSANVFATPR